jgi:uncharacterized protein
MLPVLEKLLILQERDEKLTQLTEELARLPLEEQALERKWQSASTRLDHLKGTLKQLEVERKTMDLNATAKREQINRYKGQQLETRKNEEFTALNHQIEHAEKEIATIEDDELVIMERSAELEKQVAAEAAALKVQEAEVAKQRNDIAVKKGRIETEIATVKGLQAEAEQEVVAVDEAILPRYRRILQSKKKQAVVPLSHGICGGCHMKVTAQSVVAARSNQIVACESCGRLLYPTD